MGSASWAELALTIEFDMDERRLAARLQAGVWGFRHESTCFGGAGGGCLEEPSLVRGGSESGKEGRTMMGSREHRGPETGLGHAALIVNGTCMSLLGLL